MDYRLSAGRHSRPHRVAFIDEHDERTVRTWAGKISPQMYGEGLQDLCRKTQENLDSLSESISRGDPCVTYGIKHWHPDKRPVSATGSWRKRSDLLPTDGRRNDTNVMFTSPDVLDNMSTNTESNDTDCENQAPINFCYLCSTLEEHRRHMLLHRPKRPVSAKARIEYVAPKPTQKKPESDEEEEYAKENLYKIDVFTGDEPNAGTDANVFITIKGSRDLLPRTQLKKARGCSKFTFLRNTKETFYIQGPKLGNLEIVTIEHDGLEKKHSWFLDRIEITEMRFDQIWIFVCNKWLSLHIKDYRIKIDLIGKEKEVPSSEYQITVVTGKKKLAGTDSDIYLTLYGQYGASKKIHLIDKTSGKKMFERGSVDNFRILMKHLGELRRIRIEHDGKGFAPGWFLDRVIINCPDNPKDTYYFVYNGWIAKDVGDGLLYREIKAKKTLPKELLQGTKTTFHVTVKTGNKRYAGTDANVFIQICGKKGMSKKLKLDDAKNNFERGMTDDFQMEVFDVGKIEKIIIGHDNFGPGAGWYLDWVKVRRYLPKQEVVAHLKQMKRKIAEKKGKRSKDRDLDDDSETEAKQKWDKYDQDRKKNKHRKKDSDSDTDSSSSDEEKDKKSKGVRKDRDRQKKKENRKKRKEDDEDELSMRVPLYEEYDFICENWLAQDEGDGLTERELSINSRNMFYRD